MKKYHELTEKISNEFKVNEELMFSTNRIEIEGVVEVVIREWLEEKANRIDECLKMTGHEKHALQILGLTPDPKAEIDKLVELLTDPNVIKAVKNAELSELGIKKIREVRKWMEEQK